MLIVINVGGVVFVKTVSDLFDWFEAVNEKFGWQGQGLSKN